jgi:hypothetical protein
MKSSADSGGKPTHVPPVYLLPSGTVELAEQYRFFAPENRGFSSNALTINSLSSADGRVCFRPSRMAMRRLKEAEEERTELLAKGWVMS